MSTCGVFKYNSDAVRVRVKKNGNTADCRRFSIDPQITSFEILQSIIGKAFEIQGDFALSYKTLDDYGQEALLPLLSDWDLDAAFISASDPCLTINIDIKHSDERPLPSSMPTSTIEGHRPMTLNSIELPRKLPNLKPTTNRLPGLIKNRMEKTIIPLFQKAFNLIEEPLDSSPPPRPPLTDAQFRTFLDPIGQILNLRELRTAIYFGGVECSLRKVVWKHILNVYPLGMSGRERIDYMKRKSLEYESLKDTWRNALKRGCLSEELAYVTSMVRKDVLRTDRHLPFYAGSDDNKNITSLFNILTTYAMNHPTVSYCQGMSDLASPLLVTMGDEAQAYICFCALMTRLKPNFQIDGITMTLKFQHLTEGLKHCDPSFYAYLQRHQADDLLFCYRWLLLEMKREFAFEHALHMLEVLWSSLDHPPPIEELPLFETRFSPSSTEVSPVSPLVKMHRESPYTKVRSLRRQNSSQSISNHQRVIISRKNQSLDEPLNTEKSHIGQIKPFFSLDDNTIETRPKISPLELMKRKINIMKTSSSDNINQADIDESKLLPKKSIKNLNEFRNFRKSQCSSISESVPNEVFSDSEKSSSSVFGDDDDDVVVSSQDSSPEYCPVEDCVTMGLKKDLDQLDKNVLAEDDKKPVQQDSEVFVWENPIPTEDSVEQPAQQPSFLTMGASTTTYLINSVRTGQFMKSTPRALAQLPPPTEFGAGNPFLMFLCLTLLRQHRDYIMGMQLDYNEMAMHFDKRVRKHDVKTVLDETRHMFAMYLKQHSNVKSLVNNGDVKV